MLGFAKAFSSKLSFSYILLFSSSSLQRNKIEIISTMSKRMKMSSMQLESLPNEMLLEIFSYMSMQELLQCGQVSKRIREICSDKSLWEDTDLIQKRVKAEFIKSILDRNCEELCIMDTVIDGCVKLNRPSQLAYLSLKSCINGDSTKDFLIEILNSCCSLEVLALNNKPTHSLNMVIQDLCKRNGQTLQVLNLAECTVQSRFSDILSSDKS